MVVKRALDRGGTPGFWFSPSSPETLSEAFSNSSVSLKKKDNKATLVLLFLRPWRVYEKALNKARPRCCPNPHKAKASTQFSPLPIVAFLNNV